MSNQHPVPSHEPQASDCNICKNVALRQPSLLQIISTFPVLSTKLLLSSSCLIFVKSTLSPESSSFSSYPFDVCDLWKNFEKAGS